MGEEGVGLLGAKYASFHHLTLALSVLLLRDLYFSSLGRYVNLS